MKRLVFLVPGFFGFTSVGAVSYFEHVEQTLAVALRRRDVEARIVRCATQPTGSIARRADALRRQVLRHADLDGDELHFVGHSTGGLDVRMLLTPGVKIARGDSEDRIARRTRTAVSVVTPHHGTPLAHDMLSIQGQALLQVASALATSGHGRRALVVSARLVAWLARLDDWLGRDRGPMDRLSAAVLRRLRVDQDDPVWKYLDDIEHDQGALVQLTPEGTALIDAAVVDRAGIDYGCVVAGVSKPTGCLGAQPLRDPEYAALRTLFRLLYALTSRPRPHYPYPKPGAAVQHMLDQALGFEATAATNDGIVPTLSQLHGRVLHVARADHLDIVGHYTLAGSRTADWLPSGAQFTTEAFEEAWDAIAAAIARRRSEPAVPVKRV